MHHFHYVVVFIALLFAGAGQAEPPRVVADIPPVHSLAAQVMKGVGNPDLLVRRGASPHEYSLRPSEAKALESADFVFAIGEDLTPWLERSRRSLAPQAESIELLKAPSTRIHSLRDGPRFSDVGKNGASDDERKNSATDPHAWLDPENGKTWLELIASRLAEADPGNAETYRANARAGRATIDDAVEYATTLLEPVRSARYIVFHDAYQYFERAFEVPASGSISLGDASDPSPSRVEAVRDLVAELNISCVYAEPQYNPSMVATVIDGTDSATAVIDPLGMELDLGPSLYPALLRDLAERMAGCFRAAP